MQAQARFSQARDNWQRVQDTNEDPVNPTTSKDATGKIVRNKLNDAQRQSYYIAYVQAELALHQAAQAVERGGDSERKRA